MEISNPDSITHIVYITYYGGDGGGGAGERTGQRRGPRGDLRALPRLNGL